MIAVVCVEDRGGMAFGGRRVSRDRAQVQDLLSLAAGRKLWMAPASEALFAGQEGAFCADEAFLEKAGAGEFCFVEKQALEPLLPRLEQVVVYRWNRAYPADVRLDLDLTALKLADRREFPGNSHEMITREIYERRD